MTLKYSVTGWLLAAVTSAFAQTVSISKIDESRSTADGFFDNKCEIELKITGDEVRKYKRVKVSKISTVVDEQGLNLIKDDNRFNYEEIDNNATVTIETKIPARKSTVIKEISGEVTLYNPTEENGAILKITDYQNKTNVNLLPAKAGVQLVYLTKESIEKYAKDQKAKKEEELKKMPEPARKMAEEMLKVFDGLSNFSTSPGDLTFLIQGDESKFIDLYFEDETGKKVKHHGYSQTNNLITYFFNEKPSAGSKLVLNIENDASVKRIPFMLTNVELP